MMNKEDFVTYKQAVKLKELGFDWECTHGYYMFNDKEPWLNTCGYAKNTIGGDFFYYSAPTLAQAQKWLREVKRLHLWIESERNEFLGEIMYVFYILDENRWIYPAIEGEKCHDTYEQALSAGISKALELLKDD